MADIPMNGGRTVRSGQSFVTAANWAGAALSLALMVGIGVWGYKLLARDVSGVPVVRAAEGPMRIAPADPGGTPAEHQGLAVNKVAATSDAAPADRVILAPRPVGLTDEDVPQPSIEKLRQATAPAAARITPGQTETPQQYASIQALADAIAGDAQPLSELEEETTGAVEEDTTGQKVAAVIAEVAAPDTVDRQGIARSPRPVSRPEGPRVASLETPLAASVLDVDPDAVPAGTRLVQLGAFDSPETARAEWDRIATRFEGYFDGKNRVVQKASSGGRIFYRLRAMGFEDLSDARRFCSALVAEKADCIPVVLR